MSDVTHRRLREVQEFIDAKNWKKALQACEKLSKRGEKSDAFLATRAFVLTHQSEERQVNEGRRFLIQLCTRTPPVTEEDTIRLIEHFLRKSALENANVVQLWERAALASPKDKKLQEQWVARAVAQLDWLSAQKGAMMLRKQAPNDRKYEFWVIFMCLRIERSGYDEKTRKLFGTMAYKMISKAASLTPMELKKEVEPSSEKAILTADELFLLIVSTVRMGLNAEGLELLQSPKLGLRSQIARHNLATFQALFVALLQRTHSPEQLMQLCKSLLGLEEDSSEGLSESTTKPIVAADSQVLWHHLLSAAEQCPQPESFEDLQRLLAVYREKHPVDRLSAVAYMGLLNKRLQLGHEIGRAAYNACQDFYLAFSDKPTCFQDMKDLLNSLSLDELKSFLLWIGDHSQMKSSRDHAPSMSFSNTNSLLVAYNYHGRDMGDMRKLTDSFNMAMNKIIDVGKFTTKIDPHEVPVMLVAVASLIRLRQTLSDADSNKSDPLLPALLICLFLSNRHPDNYQLVILIVRLSQLLGACSTSLTFAKTLSIKNLQWDTFGHIALTRISCLHPHNVHGSRDVDEVFLSPAGSLKNALNLYRRGDDLQSKVVMQGLENGSYQNADDAVEFSTDLSKSICRRIYFVELQRIQRLTGQNLGFEPCPYYEGSTDRRTFEVFPDFEPTGKKSVEEQIRPGPLPDDDWLEAMIQAQGGWEFLRYSASALHPREQLEGRYKKTLKAYERCDPEKVENMHKGETLPCRVQLTLSLVALSIYCNKHAVPLENIEVWRTDGIDAVIVTLKSWEKSVSDYSFQYPTSNYFIRSYMILDTLKMIRQLLQFATAMKKSKAAPPMLEREREDVLKIFTSKIQNHIHERARRQRDELTRTQGMLEKLMAFPFREKVVELLGEAEVETLLGGVRDSWEEALERLAGTRVL